MLSPSPEQVRRDLSKRLFAKDIVQNNFRGEVAEEIVRLAISPEWDHCGGDWNAWDFKHHSKSIRVQVKQSAEAQSWHSSESDRRSGGKFAVPLQSGFYEGDDWRSLKPPKRIAQIYIFCWHPVTANAKPNHFDVSQWHFFVALESKIAPSKLTMSVRELRAMTEGVWSADFHNLRTALDLAALSVEPYDLSGVVVAKRSP